MIEQLEQIRELELTIYNNKLGSNSLEFEKMRTLTDDFLNVKYNVNTKSMSRAGNSNRMLLDEAEIMYDKMLEFARKGININDALAINGFNPKRYHMLVPKDDLHFIKSELVKARHKNKINQ